MFYNRGPYQFEVTRIISKTEQTVNFYYCSNMTTLTRRTSETEPDSASFYNNINKKVFSEKKSGSKWHLIEYKNSYEIEILEGGSIGQVVNLKLSNASYDLLTRYIKDDFSYYINYNKKPYFYEYHDQYNWYVYQALNDYEIYIIQKIIEFSIKTINQMISEEYSQLFNNLYSCFFGDSGSRDEFKRNFITIAGALNNIDFDIPYSKNPFSRYDGSNKFYFLKKHNGAIGETACSIKKIGNDYDYFSKNVITIQTEFMENCIKHTNIYPNIKKKSLTEVFIHEIAHLSLKLERDIMYNYYDRIQRNESSLRQWREKYFGRDFTARNITDYTEFINKDYVTRNLSNAEHYAVFFEIFYLCIDKGITIEDVINILNS